MSKDDHPTPCLSLGMARQRVSGDAAPDVAPTISMPTPRLTTSRALHFCESLGSIASLRTPGNQRRYARHMLRRVSLISVAQRLGIPLTDVQEAFADVPLTETPSHHDWQRASRRWKRELEKPRVGIERLEQELTGCIGCGCLAMKACRLLNPDDELANQGTGPQRLRDLPGV